MTTIEQKKETYAQLAFMHSIITQRTQYFVDEFELAGKCARTITDMANKLADDIKSDEDEQQPKPDVEANEQI